MKVKLEAYGHDLARLLCKLYVLAISLEIELVHLVAFVLDCAGMRLKRQNGGSAFACVRISRRQLLQDIAKVRVGSCYHAPPARTLGLNAPK